MHSHLAHAALDQYVCNVPPNRHPLVRPACVAAPACPVPPMHKRMRKHTTRLDAAGSKRLAGWVVHGHVCGNPGVDGLTAAGLPGCRAALPTSRAESLAHRCWFCAPAGRRARQGMVPCIATSREHLILSARVQVGIQGQLVMHHNCALPTCMHVGAAVACPACRAGHVGLLQQNHGSEGPHMEQWPALQAAGIRGSPSQPCMGRGAACSDLVCRT